MTKRPLIDRRYFVARDNANKGSNSMVNAVRSLLVVCGLAFSAWPASAGAIRTFPAFQPTSLPKGDDISSPAVPLGFTIGALGWSSASVYINTNGGITFKSPYVGYPGMPEDNHAGGVIPPIGSSTQPIISAFLADIDTSAPAVGAITYGTAALSGRPVFVVNYLNVTGFSFSSSDFDLKRNSFQIVLVERSDTGAGNFDIEFNYDRIQWETADSNGGTSGAGDYSALVGYSNGTSVAGTFYELPGSGVPGSYADGGGLSLVSGSQNNGVAGRYIFAIRNTVTPSVGSSPVSAGSTTGAGVKHSFAFTFSDPSGWRNLGVVNVLINNFLNGDHACYLAYDTPSNTLYLVSDAGTSGGISALALNGSGSVSNSQCTVNGVESSASGSGNTMTLILSLSFNQTTFSGDKITYVAARDIAENNSGWRILGVWRVPQLVPTYPSIISVTSNVGLGSTQQFSVTYRDVSSSANLRNTQVLINSKLDGKLACYLGYDHANNVLYLVNDDSSSLTLPGIVPNTGSGTVENSQCRVNGGGTTKNETGTDLTLTIDLTFKSSFTGPKVVYTGVQTISNANSDWHASSLLNVP